MSAIAHFVKMPLSAIDGLNKAAIAQKSLFRGRVDRYNDYLREYGREVVQYRWSGYVLATLLPYLAERHQIDLMNSGRAELAEFLSRTRGATHFIFTSEQRKSLIHRLASEPFSQDEMREYFNEFNATNEDDVGLAMFDGVVALRECLGQLDDDSAIVLMIA
jgi:hypothetical protein